MTATSETFACNTCSPPNADDAWGALRLLRLEFELVDESHFMIKLRSCPNCQQHFLSVFAETIDWADGEDPQFWCLLPITPAESKMLSGSGGESVSQLYALAPDRRSLCHGSPKGGDPVSYWSSDVVIGPHDS